MQPPATSSRVPRWLGLIFAGCGLICLVAGICVFFQTREFVRTATKTNGVVIAMKSSQSDDRTTYAPVFQFMDASNATHEVSSSMYSSPPGFHVGEKVEVLYQPGNPDQARINSAFQVWGVAGVLAIIGAIFCIVGFCFAYRSKIAGWFKPRLTAHSHA